MYPCSSAINLRWSVLSILSYFGKNFFGNSGHFRAWYFLNGAQPNTVGVTVIVKTRDNPDMGMLYFVAKSQEVNWMASDDGLGPERDFFCRFPIATKIRDIIHPAIVFFGDEQTVAGIYGVNIKKSEKVDIFVDFEAW